MKTAAASVRSKRLTGKTGFCKPISCALYPIREVQLTGGKVGLNYHRWNVCRDAVKKGKELQLPVYKFLEGPLTRRFGAAWYQELCDAAKAMKEQGYLGRCHRKDS